MWDWQCDTGNDWTFSKQCFTLAWHWQCNNDCVTMAMCHWQYDTVSVALTMWHWQCNNDRVTMAMCHWQYDTVTKTVWERITLMHSPKRYVSRDSKCNYSCTSVKPSESTDELVVAILDPLLTTTTSSTSRFSTLCSCSLKCVYAAIPATAAHQQPCNI